MTTNYNSFTDEERAMHAAVRAGTHTLAYDTELKRIVLVPKESPADERDRCGSEAKLSA